MDGDVGVENEGQHMNAGDEEVRESVHVEWEFNDDEHGYETDNILDKYLDDGMEDFDFSSDEEFILARKNLLVERQKRMEVMNENIGEDLANPSSIPHEDYNGYKSEYEDSNSSIASLTSDDEGQSRKRIKNRALKYSESCDHSQLKLELGMRFKDCMECKDAVVHWAIANGYNIKWKKSGRQKLQAHCVENCPWKLYASKLTTEPTCVIKTYVGNHNCVRVHTNRQANSKWLAKAVLEKLKVNPMYSARDIKRDAQIKYGIMLSRMMCYRAKWRAIRKLRGTFKEHYAKLRSYVTELRKMDVEGRFELKTYLDKDSRPVFQRIYIGFSALCKGLLVGCRKAIRFDACFLKTVLGGALLVAVSKDCNLKMYPIAWAVVEKENEETWSCFFEILFEDLHIFDGLGWTFISDKQKGLINGIHKFAPNAEHKNCARHIYANWKKMFGGPKYKRMFWDVVKSSNHSKYMYKLNELKVESVTAYDEFRKRDPEKFCKALISTFTKCDLVDNNMCESFNSYILNARDKPLINMLRDIRLSLMGRISRISKEIGACQDILCPNIRKKLDKIQIESRFCTIIHGVDAKFEVQFHDETYIVDLGCKNCSCRTWELTGILCCHALACIIYNREKLESYVDPFFYTSNCVKMYKHGLSPIHGELDWPVVDEAPIMPPKYIRPPGRPKKQRKRDQFEASKHTKTKLSKRSCGIRMTCKKCGTIGHNKRTCMVVENRPGRATE